MIDVVAWERNVRLIGELCVELTSLGLKVRLSDARPSLFVRCVGDDQLHRVEVLGEGECFAWARGKQRHTCTDPRGAAACIAAFARQAVPPGSVPAPGRGPIVCETATPDAAQTVDDPAELVERLVYGCRGAGLEAVVLEPCTKVRVNLVGGTSLMAEIITMRPDAAEVSCWWWSWNEPICPAADIDQAVAMIAAVVAVVDP